MIVHNRVESDCYTLYVAVSNMVFHFWQVSPQQYNIFQVKVKSKSVFCPTAYLIQLPLTPPPPHSFISLSAQRTEWERLGRYK